MNPYACLVQGQLIHYPLIEIQPVNFFVEINKYDGIVFTSKQAVNVFCKRYAITKRQKIISIGPQTSCSLEEYGYKVACEAGIPDSDVLAELIKKLKLKKILYPCSNLSDNKIHKLCTLEKKIIYKTIAKKQEWLDLGLYSGIVFTSPSTVLAFLNIYKTIPKHLALYVYGKHTAKKLVDEGYGKNIIHSFVSNILYNKI